MVFRYKAVVSSSGGARHVAQAASARCSTHAARLILTHQTWPNATHRRDLTEINLIGYPRAI